MRYGCWCAEHGPKLDLDVEPELGPELGPEMELEMELELELKLELELEHELELCWFESASSFLATVYVPVVVYLLAREEA